jgi:hypothetical protein
MTNLSPLGFPIDGRVGRGGSPSMDELARDVGASRAHGGDDVRHVCPECAGPLAQGAALAVETCSVCRGVGTLSDDELIRYLSVLNRGRILG